MIKLPRKILTLMQIVLAISIGTSMLRAQNSDTNKTSSAVISGTVSMRDGSSLPNARIVVGRVNSVSSRQHPVRLDDSGHFETEPLEPGLYWVSVFAPGYVSESQASGSTLGPASWYRPGDTVSLTLAKGGVITGTVKNANGDPVVAIPVRATMVKNREGKPLQFSSSFRSGISDDRGVYRLYGLPPGTYVVLAGGAARPGFILGTSIFEVYAPTYAPSASRDTASEIVVNGEEVNADVQFREERGHIISGTIAGGRLPEGAVQSYGVLISLFDPRNHFEVGNASASATNSFAFAIYGVPDGEYELYASQGSDNGDAMISPARTVKIQGADVTGINLLLAAAGNISGRVVLENDAKAACGKHKSDAMLETMIYARRYRPDQKTKDKSDSDVPYVYRSSARLAVMDAKGNFEVKGVRAGSYRIDPREPASGWFVKSITAGLAPRPVSIARDGLILKSGERASSLVVTIAEGGSQLSGKIILSEGQTLPAKTRVYLVPAEREAADNPLRFFDARPDANGKFRIDFIAPGRYLIIARATEENEYGVAKSVRFDLAFRDVVLQSATATKKEVSFKPCEETVDYELPLTTSTSP